MENSNYKELYDKAIHAQSLAKLAILDALKVAQEEYDKLDDVTTVLCKKRNNAEDAENWELFDKLDAEFNDEYSKQRELENDIDYLKSML